MILRGILFLLLVGFAAVAPVVLFVLAACAYALMYTAYELIFLAVVLDGLYGSLHPFLIPYYTIGACALLLCVEWIKPYISRYNQ